MEEKVMSIEEIDSHLATTAQSGTRDIGSAVNDICKTYNDVRPILVFAKGILFFKPKWQAVIQSLIAAMDNNCNVSSPGKS